MLLGDEDSKEIRLSVDQDDVDAFFANSENQLRSRGKAGYYRTHLSHIEPRASLEPLHPAIAATKGGPLPVRSKPKESQDKKEESNAGVVMNCCRRNSTAEVKLSPGAKRSFSRRPARTR